MSKIKLHKNDDIVILTLDHVDYIAVLDDSVSPYTKYPEDKPCSPEESKWTVTEDESVTVNVNENIEDGYSRMFSSIVGPRPRNIVRR